jgi:bifunctional non-homologous end joining protein LigD
VVAGDGGPESKGSGKADIEAALEALDGRGETCRLRLDGHELRVTSLNKVYWPAWGKRRALLKRDLLRYYVQVAHYVLPHLRDRPVTMRRFPTGLLGKKFYERAPGPWAPPFVQRFTAFTEKSQGDEEYFVCNNAATLVWLGQVSNLELHVAHTRVGPGPDAPGLGTQFAGSLAGLKASTLNYPDLLVTDLDPYIYSGKERLGQEPELNRKAFATVVEVARAGGTFPPKTTFFYPKPRDGLVLRPLEPDGFTRGPEPGAATGPPDPDASPSPEPDAGSSGDRG